MKTLTSKQIAGVVADYHKYLPDWQHVADETLVRTDGPILQAIGFQALSGGDYRPMNYVQVLVAPEPDRTGRVDFFAQFPKGRPRTVSMRSHDVLRKQMLETMVNEFIPRIIDPLDAKVVLDLCEQTAIPKSGQAYALAAYNAYMGCNDRALFWNFRYDQLVSEMPETSQPWHHQQRMFLDSLVQWLTDGNAKAHLEKVLAQERAKWRLPI